VHYGTVDSVSKFWKFIGVELGLTLKSKFLPHDLFYKNVNLQKFWMSESICFKAQNRANRSQFFSLRFSRFCLTLNPFQNSITSAIVGFSLCMSITSIKRICRPSWRTPCPSFSTSGFILVILIYLSDQFPEFFQKLLNVWHVWKFNIFFDFGRWCMHVNWMEEQYF
jgi:hypothetical protein